MKQELVITRIKETAENILPEGASLWLYGSRARGDARPDSDYDLLILFDKDVLQEKDTDVICDLAELGWDLSAVINAHAYPRSKWNSWSYSPFYKNVEHDKIVLI